MDDAFRADLDLVVARLNAPRLRELTDPAHPAYDAAYLPVVRAEAARLRAEPSLPPAAAPPRAAKPRVPLGTRRH